MSISRRWTSPPPGYDNTLPGLESSTLPPYLTLPYILSLTWLAYPILSLLFIAFRLSISSASAENSVSDAKDRLLSSCQAAQKAATVAASLPRYMAIATNERISDAVNDTMNAARAALVLSLTVVEAIINFVIDIYRSTFLCFLELVVRGGLDVLLSAVNEINSFLTSAFSSVKSTLEDGINSVNSAIQSAVDGINDVNPFGDITAPQFSVDLSSLDNVTLPTDFTDALNNLNNSLPSLDQIRSEINDFVDTPFEDLKADINNTFAGLSYNSSALFVPQQDTVSFCDEMDTSAVDNLGKDIANITKIGIVLIVVLALLLIAAHCALEWYKWRCLQDHLRYTREAWVSDPTMNNSVGTGEIPNLKMTDHNLMVLAGGQQHPLLMRIANRISARLRMSPAQQSKLQWFFHYIFHPPAFAVFLIGFLGLLSVEIQLAAIHPLQAKYEAEVASSVQDFSNTIATSINNSMYNQSAAYADSINSQINSTQSTINDGLFGWVNGTTTTLNDTLATFYSDVQNAVSTVFNGTVLEDPMQEFIKCIIGSKIEAIEEALTFLNENLQIDLPTVNQSALVLSQSNIDEVSKPISDAAVGDGSDDSGGIVAKVINSYVASLEKERLMFGVFIALWGFVVLIAVGIILWHSYAIPYLAARKRRRFREERVNGVAPFRTGNEKASSDEKAANQAQNPTPESGVMYNIGLNTPTRNANEYKSHEPQRSWDALLDHSAQQEQSQGSQLKKKISRPMKLRAIGSKAGREHFISDEERARMQQAEMEFDEAEDRQGATWMKRFTSVFQKKPADDIEARSSEGSSFGSPSRGRTRAKPNLTIATKFMNGSFNNMSRDQLPTAGLSAGPEPSPHPQKELKSAWSITPNEPNTSSKIPQWAIKPLNLASKQLGNKPRLPGLPSSPRSPPRPQDAYGGIGIGAFPMPMPSNITVSGPAAPARAATVTPAAQEPYTAHSAIPSYYNSNLPHYAGRESLLPPLSVSQQQNALSYNTTKGKESESQNPFRTPFDDDARVVPENWPKPPSAPNARNPFAEAF